MTFLGIGPGELIMIAILALVVVGPDRLPVMARQAGRLLVTVRNWMQSSPDAALVLRARQEIEQELASLRTELLEVQNVRNEVLGVAKQIDEVVSPIKSARLDQVSDLLKPDAPSQAAKPAEKVAETSASDDTASTIETTADTELSAASEAKSQTAVSELGSDENSIAPVQASVETVEAVETTAEQIVSEVVASAPVAAPAPSNPALSLIKPPTQPTVAAGSLTEDEEPEELTDPAEIELETPKQKSASDAELDSLFALDEPVVAAVIDQTSAPTADPTTEQAEQAEQTTPSESSNALLLAQMQTLTQQMQTLMSDMAALQDQLTQRGILDATWKAPTSADSVASEEDRQ